MGMGDSISSSSTEGESDPEFMNRGSPDAGHPEGTGPPSPGQADRPRKTALSNWAWVVLLALTIVGGLSRFWNLGGPSFWNDEASTSLLAIHASRTGWPGVAGYTLPLISFSPLYPEVEGALFRLFGVSQWCARIPSAVAGVLLIPLAYVMAWKVSRDQLVALLTSGLVAASTEYIAWSRQARQYMLFVLLLVLAVVFFETLLVAKTPRRRAASVGSLVGVSLLLFLTDPVLFLLYSPAFLIGLFVFYLWIRRDVVRDFLRGIGISWSESDALPRSSLTTRGRWIVAIVLIAVTCAAILVFVYPATIGSLVQRTVGTQTYPFTFIPFYIEYLALYYGWVVVLSAVGAVLTLINRRSGELAFLGFIGGGLFSVSFLLSLVVNIASVGTPPERYITPLLVFLFYFAAAGIVGTCRMILAAWKEGSQPNESSLRVRSSRTRAGVGAVAIAVIVGASMIAPTGLYLYSNPEQGQYNSQVPWTPFSFWPSYSSALYGVFQPNYEYTSEYVGEHRLSTDAIAASWPEAPAFYLGSVGYWIAGTLVPGASYNSSGVTRYYYTGSILISNPAELENLMRTTSGWYIQDAISGAGLAGHNLTLVAQFMMNIVPAGSSPSVNLLHWNLSTNLSLLDDVWMHRPDLQRALGMNQTKLIDWAAISGVSNDGLRPILLPLEPYLVSSCDNSTKPLATLLGVFNTRADLQTIFPSVFSGNFTSLIWWAEQVVSGTIVDPAYPVLEPYASWYESASGT